MVLKGIARADATRPFRRRDFRSRARFETVLGGRGRFRTAKLTLA
jgi:hypothetical protein